MAKDNSQVLKQMWNDWRDDYRDKEKYMSPFGLADSVAINEFPKQLCSDVLKYKTLKITLNDR